MNCHGEDNPYLLFFLHLERYGLIGQFTSGDASYRSITEMAISHGISPQLLWKLAARTCVAKKEEGREQESFY